MGLDLVGLENERLLLRLGDYVVDVGYLAQQGGEPAPAVAGAFLEIGAHAAAQAFRLSDVQVPLLGVLHQVDAGAVRERVELQTQLLGQRGFHALPTSMTGVGPVDRNGLSGI